MHSARIIRIARFLMAGTLLVGGAGSMAAPKKPVKAAPQKPASTAAAPLVPLEKELYHEALIGEVGWSLVFKVPNPPARPFTDQKGAHQAFERYLAAAGVGSASHEAEKTRLRALRPQVAKLFGEALTRIGDEPIQFLPNEKLSPVRLAQLPGGPALLVGSVVINDVLNTQEGTAGSRAAQVAQQACLPILRRMHSTLKATKLPYLGCVVTYGSKDFTDESPTTFSLKGEVLGVVVSQAELRKLAAGQTTEKDLLQRSQTYLRERGTSDMKKIGLTLP